jgi:hypothetical protein
MLVFAHSYAPIQGSVDLIDLNKNYRSFEVHLVLDSWIYIAAIIIAIPAIKFAVRVIRWKLKKFQKQRA